MMQNFSMHLTRRQFLLGGVAGLGAMASPALLRLLAPDARPGSLEEYTQGFSALSRISFGPTLADCQRLENMGLKAYLNEQLAPVDAEDLDSNARLNAATLH